MNLNYSDLDSESVNHHRRDADTDTPPRMVTWFDLRSKFHFHMTTTSAHTIRPPPRIKIPQALHYY